MSYTLEFELKQRWKLWIIAGPDDEYYIIVDSDQELAFQLMILDDDPEVTVRYARYRGTRPAGSWRDQLALAGLR